MKTRPEGLPISKSLSHIRAVLLDLDDTLFLEHTYVLSGIRAVAEFLSSKGALPVDPESLFRELAHRFLKYGRIGLFDEAVEQCGGISIAEVVAAYRNHQPQISFMPGVPEHLSRLRAHYKLAVVTDGNQQMQSNKIKALDIGNLVDEIVFCDQLSAPKPDPKAFLHATELLGVNVSNAIIIGDDPEADMQAARTADMKAIRVCTGRFGLLESPSNEFLEVPNFIAASRLLLERKENARVGASDPEFEI